MLLEEFDKEKRAFFNPDFFHKKNPEMPKTCVSFFSKKLIDQIVQKFNPQKIAKIENATKVFDIYKIDWLGTPLAIVQSPVGAPACVSNFEEIIAMGVENFLLVGCCGCLNNDMKEYSIILPTSAIRDEGTSYHYAPVSDETFLNKNVIELLKDELIRKRIHFKEGKTWTTDAIFRETKDKIEKRKRQGAITVEMECSAMNVVSEFRNVNFGQILYGADSLANEDYDPRTLVSENNNFEKKEKIIPISLDCAVRMDKELTINKEFN